MDLRISVLLITATLLLQSSSCYIVNSKANAKEAAMGMRARRMVTNGELKSALQRLLVDLEAEKELASIHKQGNRQLEGQGDNALVPDSKGASETPLPAEPSNKETPAPTEKPAEQPPAVAEATAEPKQTDKPQTPGNSEHPAAEAPAVVAPEHPAETKAPTTTSEHPAEPEHPAAPEQPATTDHPAPISEPQKPGEVAPGKPETGDPHVNDVVIKAELEGIDKELEDTVGKDKITNVLRVDEELKKFADYLVGVSRCKNDPLDSKYGEIIDSEVAKHEAALRSKRSDAKLVSQHNHKTKEECDDKPEDNERRTQILLKLLRRSQFALTPAILKGLLEQMASILAFTVEMNQQCQKISHLDSQTKPAQETVQ